MNRALFPSEMLHCADMTVLERQKALHMKWQQQQEECHGDFGGFQDGCLGEVVSRSVVKPDHGPNNGWSDLVSFGGGMNSKASDLQLQQHQSLLSSTVTSSCVSEGFRKRKLDKVHDSNKNVVAEERGKKTKGESKTIEKQSKKEKSSDSSKDNSKVTEVQKPDYIHVRARRGQATDSHSLAERVRREKISERMKYLQDLVPGCNRITGKAGMLDEIINYVQSLQRQVEFLSMKLAAVNPKLQLNFDNLLAKEPFSACATNFPTIQMSSDVANPHYHQLNPLLQQQLGVNPPDVAPRRDIAHTFPDSSYFPQLQALSTWDGDLQNLYNVAFDEARTTSYPSQQFTGSIEGCNMKMEM